MARALLSGRPAEQRLLRRGPLQSLPSRLAHRAESRCACVCTKMMSSRATLAAAPNTGAQRGSPRRVFDASAASQYAFTMPLTFLIGVEPVAALAADANVLLDGGGLVDRAVRRRARQSASSKSHTLHFSASFLIARSIVSATVDVGIPRTSPISR